MRFQLRNVLNNEKKPNVVPGQVRDSLLRLRRSLGNREFVHEEEYGMGMLLLDSAAFAQHIYRLLIEHLH